MRPIEKVFDIYGRFLARHPIPFLIIPLLVTIVSIFGFFNFHSQDDIWDIYAPLNAKSRYEEKALEQFEYASAAHHYRIQILVDRKDGRNLLDASSLAEIGLMNKLIIENLTISDGSKIYLYPEICGVYCNDSNAIVLGFLQAVIQSKGESTNFLLTYPNAHALQSSIFLGYSLGNLHFIRKHNYEIVDEFRLFILHYMVDLRLSTGKLIRDNFEAELRNLFARATDDSKNLNYALLSRKRELEEQRQISVVSVPYLGVTGIVLTLFMLVTLVDFPLHKSQHIEAIFGVISPAMALVTTFGFLWAIGIPFSNILTVVPFLVMTIGIDDAFLILAGWRFSNKKASLEERIGEAMSKSGASISVTSITDVLCFATGLISQMPVVRLFCLYTTLALAVDFIFQVTFFAAAVVFCGRRKIQQEEVDRLNKKENNLVYFLGRNMEFQDIISGSSSSTESTSSAASSYVKKLKKSIFNGWKTTKVGDGGTMFTSKSGQFDVSKKEVGTSKEENDLWLWRFIDFLHHPMSKATIFSIFLIHIIASIYLCTLVNTDFDMENLYLKSSPLTEISQKMQNFVLSEAFVVNFALTHMGSFEDFERRRTFNNMVVKLENIPKFGMGDKGTGLWTRDYEQTVAFWNPDEHDSMWEPLELLRNYRAFHLDEKYITIGKNEQGEEVIDSFYWYITYHNMSSFLEVESMLEKRIILAEYAHIFNISSHHPLEKVPTESAASAPSNFIQTAVSAIILMSVLVLLFVMNVEAMISVVISIVSVSCGTVAYLHLWDVRLDAVSLISMLMSIGFSVDYSAHICYHYFTNIMADVPANSISVIVGNSFNSLPIKPSRTSVFKSCLSLSGTQDTRERLHHTFKGVGWPVIQAGLSTIIGISPLFFVDAYVVAVFWKTIVLVTFLGMYHALFLLPVLFLVFNDLKRIFCR